MKLGRSGSLPVSVIHVPVRQMRLASLYSWRHSTQAASSVSYFLTFRNTTEGRERLCLRLLALSQSHPVEDEINDPVKTL